MGYHLFIDPFPRDFTSAELKLLLEPFGSVVRASIYYDSLGESLQFGHAEMETEEAADNARKYLNRSVFRNATLTVLKVSDLEIGPGDRDSLR